MAGGVTQMMDFLPAIYHGDPETVNAGDQPFLFRYLLPFQQILQGWQKDDGRQKDGGAQKDDGRQKHGKLGEESSAPALDAERLTSLAEAIDRFSLLLDPAQTRESFLDWLADWVALNIHAPLSLSKRRQLIARFISLNRIRGTKKYLEELLPFFIDAGITIEEEQSPECQIGVHSTLDQDFQLGGGPAHVFRIALNFPAATGEELDRQCRIADYVVSLSKPAHTLFELNVITATFQIGVHSTIGRDTVLG